MLLGVLLTKNIIGLDNGLLLKRLQSIIRASYGLVYWRIYVSLGFNELNMIRTILQNNSTGTLTHSALDCFMLLFAQHLTDALCFIGLSMPSGIFMEIHTEIV